MMVPTAEGVMYSAQAVKNSKGEQDLNNRSG
jgi:hypothetical protein